MTSPSLMTKGSLNVSTTATVDRPASLSSSTDAERRQSRLMQAMRSQYRLDQQLAFLNLQAEAESLFQQLQVIKQQRKASNN